MCIFNDFAAYFYRNREEERQREKNPLSLNKVLFVNPLKCIFAFRVFASVTTSPKNEIPERWDDACTWLTRLSSVIHQRDDYILQVSRYVPKPADTSRAARKSIRRQHVPLIAPMHTHNKPRIRTCLIYLINFCFV